MNKPLIVPAGERGVVRLFALNNQLSMEIHQSGLAGNLSRAFGLAEMHDDDVQLVKTEEISDVGLAAFLIEAYDIDPAEIALYDDTLKTISGEIAIVRSGAFAGHMAELKTDGAATLIAAFGEPVTDWSATRLQTRSAHSRISPRAARASARRIGFSLFAGMMTLIFIVVFWIFT